MIDEDLKALRCPKCNRKMHLTEVMEQRDSIVNGGITCEKGHTWRIEDTIVNLMHPPLREEDRKWVSEYDQMAKEYDEAVKAYDDWLQVDMMKERENLSQFLPNKKKVHILDVSIGTGSNFIALQNAIQEKVSRLAMHGLDVSDGMLRVAKSKFETAGMRVNLVKGSVFNIPFQSNHFDLVLHTGGLNTFSEKSKSLQEMFRITAKEGTVVVIDEGVSPRIRDEPRGKAIIQENSLFATRPPFQHIPERARDVEVDYVMNDTFYRIIFKK